jgi:hypothetical protein
MSSSKVKCTCGWSWNKSDSSKKDMYICHECGRDNSNNMKNGGWLDNYNDSEVSLPEGYVGEGYNTKGRDYSPAWGGQFEEGGELTPIAQNGTRADSLFLLKNNKIIKNLEKSGYKWTGKKDSHNNKVLWKQEYDFLEKNLPKLIANDKKKKQKTKPSSTYIDKRNKLLGTQDWLELGNEDYFMPKQYIHPDIVPQFSGDLKKENKDRVHSIYSYGYDDLAITPFDMLTPEQKKLRVQKYGTDGVPKSYLDKLKPTTTKATTKPIYVESKNDPRYEAYQDSLSLYKRGIEKVKYWRNNPDATNVELNIKEDEIDRMFPVSKSRSIFGNKVIDAFGSERIGSGPSERTVFHYEKPQEPVIVKPRVQPRVEALNLPPIEQAPINIPIQELDFNTPIKAPKSYNVNMQRYNMQGPSDYYQANEEGVDYERAMQIKAASDAYNKDIEKKYGPQNEYRTEKSRQEAARRLEQLKQDVKVRPNYQMGGQAPKRRGVRYNKDGSVSTHLMKTETDGKGNWFSFPTLFQNSIPYADDSENWLDMSDRPWEEAYEEAKKRGEVINFGSDKDAAIKFGQGSWKDKKQMGGSVYPVNYVPQAQNGFTSFMSDLGDSVAEFFSDDKKESPKPKKAIKLIKQLVVKKPGNKDNTRTLNISDPRKILATTNQPLRPNSDLVSGKYSSKHLDRLLQEAKRQGLSKKDMLDLSAMGFQETKWGKSDDNIGHVKGDWEGDDSYQQFISAYKEKMKLSDKLGIKDPALRLQVYNGLGTITPKTEKDYHGFEMKKIYGVPVPKEGINMKKNPLYGKQVMDIRDNVLAKNPEYLRYMDSIYKAPVPKYMEDIKVNKPSLLPDLAMGGSIPGAVGFSYARTNDPAPSNGPYAKKTMASAQNGGWLDQYKEGGVIKDDLGQWAHPGEITEIGSNQITMQGVPYPVLGVSDEGDVQMMYPEEDYEFIGNTVTEYPMAEDGIQTTTDQTTYPWSPGNKNKNRGDQLANFKNQPQQEKPKPKPNTFVDKLIAESAERKNNINLRELPPIAVNDNIPNAHNMAVKADAALVKQQQYEKIVKVKEAKAQADAQKKFNALPKAEQERIINEQRNQQYGSVTQYEPEGFWEKAGNIALTPFTALREKIQRGHVPDNLVKGIMNDPKNRLNPMDVAYLATLGYAAAPYVAQGTTAVGTAVAPYLAADAVIGGTTLTGVNAHNLIAAGFATHGLMNAGPDAVAWAENPSWEKAGHVAMDVAEVLPVAGPASKMVGEGFGLVKNKANQILTKASEVTAPVMTKGKTLIDDMGAVISGERKTIGPKLDALNDVGLKIYESDEYIKMTQESHQLQQKRWALEAKMNNLKTKGSRTEIDNLNNKITNLQKRIDVAEQFKVNGDGLIQSGKNTALGLRTGSTDIMDLSTGEKFRISTSVPTSDVIHTLEGEKVVKTLDNSKLPQVTPEYTSTVKKNIDFIETQIPGAKVFGSAKNVAEAEVPHIIGDYDVIMSQSQYNKFAKANPAVGNNGLADLHNIPGAAKGTKPIDINVIQEQGGKAVGMRAEELFKQVAPDEYYAAAKQAIQNKSEIKIPYSSQELVDMTNPTTKSVVDAYESTKTKHINKIDALINYGKPSVVSQGQEQFVKSLVGSKGSIGHQFPVEQLSNAEANVEILDKIGFIGNKKLVAADPERMQLAINDYYMNNSILARQVDNKKINTIEKAIKEYYPGAGGGNANGIGQNHVMLGHPYHGDGNIISMKQLGMNLDTKDPMSYINSIEHNVSGQKLFSEEERTILSNIIDDIKGLDDVSKITAKNSKNTSNLINNLPYSETGKQALYDFAKQTGRTIVKKEREYGNSTYASTLRDFDEAIDVMQYQVENSEKAIKSYRQRSDAARYAENSRGLSSDLELLPKQFKAIKGYVDGGIEKANERLVAAKFERTRISDEIQAISSKAFKNKYWEEINRLKETQTKIEKEIQDISQMRRDLFDRKNHLNKLEDNMKSVGILGGGTATLVGAGTIAYKNDQKMQKQWDWTVTEETKEALRVEEEKKKQEAERNAGKLKKQNGGTITKAKNGLRQEQKGLVNLDNLTNFTNYNTKQPGGWLDKY